MKTYIYQLDWKGFFKDLDIAVGNREIVLEVCIIFLASFLAYNPGFCHSHYVYHMSDFEGAEKAEKWILMVKLVLV